jgi:glycine dehydrogenase subunit 1
MPFIPHTGHETDEMLHEIGVGSITQLYEEIPPSLLVDSLSGIPEGLTEMEVSQLLRATLQKDKLGLCFIGAGAYEHYIPAAVFDLISRGEFYTAYTPYQAEASQGNLQLIYEFQTMIASLMGMDAANASVYDGSCALAEAVLMAARIRKTKTKKVLLPRTIHPSYRKVVRSIVAHQGIEVVEIDYDSQNGQTSLRSLEPYENEDIVALIVPQPNFFGVLEDVDQLTEWAQRQGALVIALVNPMAMALLKEPGQWGGAQGADIACGEGQPLGIPLASGGPYFGFMACKQTYVRQMPGRIVGRTVDLDGKQGFTLTLQAREQHIRRSKATSNICTNQGLMVTAATIYMSLLGAYGLRQAALASHSQATALLAELIAIPGVKRVFQQPFFHEFVISFDKSVPSILDALVQRGIQGGYDLTAHYPELGQSLLVCVTETKTPADIDFYQKNLLSVLREQAQHEECIV